MWNMSLVPSVWNGINFKLNRCLVGNYDYFILSKIKPRMIRQICEAKENIT